jgi:hypothetical protein
MRKIFEIVVFLTIFMASAASIVASYKHNGLIGDELVHLNCGLQWWQNGDYSIELLHPPIARIASAALPYFIAGHHLSEEYLLKLAQNPTLNYVVTYPNYSISHTMLYSKGESYRYNIKFLARLGQLPFLFILLLGVYVWVKEYTSMYYAWAALILLVSLPTVLNWSAFAMTDLPPTAFAIWAIYLFPKWVSTPSKLYSLMLGAATGLAFCAKFSSIPFVLVTFASWLILNDIINKTYSRGYKKEYVIAGLIAAASCISIILCAYRFSFDLIPVPEFLDGITATIVRDNAFEPKIFMGKLYTKTGHFMYFPTVFFFKSPITFLLLTFTALYFVIRQKSLRNLAALYPLFAAVGILAISMSANINIGIRHILIIYPLLTIFISIVLYKTCHLKLMLFAALIQVVICYQAYPDYLQYYNFLAGKQPEYIANHSNYDAGHQLHLALQNLKTMGIEKDTKLIIPYGHPDSYSFTTTTYARFDGKLLSFYQEPAKQYYLMPKVVYMILSAEDKKYFDSLTRLEFAPDLYILFANSKFKTTMK